VIESPAAAEGATGTIGAMSWRFVGAAEAIPERTTAALRRDAVMRTMIDDVAEKISLCEVKAGVEGKKQLVSSEYGGTGSQ
jgi:hypothetical protein